MFTAPAGFPKEVQHGVFYLDGHPSRYQPVQQGFTSVNRREPVFRIPFGNSRTRLFDPSRTCDFDPSLMSFYRLLFSNAIDTYYRS